MPYQLVLKLYAGDANMVSGHCCSSLPVMQHGLGALLSSV
jgi:hypothetical protein